MRLPNDAKRPMKVGCCIIAYYVKAIGGWKGMGVLFLTLFR